jgi:hypothetical protein
VSSKLYAWEFHIEDEEVEGIVVLLGFVWLTWFLHAGEGGIGEALSDFKR